jgi:hypothetical protein
MQQAYLGDEIRSQGNLPAIGSEALEEFYVLQY